MRYFVDIGENTYQIELGPQGALVDGEPVDVDLANVENTDVRHLLVDGRSHRLVAKREQDGTWDMHLRGRRVRARAVDERTRAIEEMTGAGAGPVAARSAWPSRSPPQ